MTTTLKIIGITGAVLFAALFVVTFASPETIERSAKGFVEYQIGKEVRQTYDAGVDSDVTSNALDIAEKLGFEREQIEADLDNKLPEKIAAVIAKMCGYDCEKSKAAAQSIATGYLERIKQLTVAEQSLENIVRGKYLEILGQLKADLRIFLGVNFFLFLLLFGVSQLKPQAATHLIAPAFLLLTATVAASGIYLFGQDWFYTILYNDYMGFGYLAYVGIIFAVLLDVVLNHGRVTTEIINGFFNLIGSAASVSPC